MALFKKGKNPEGEEKSLLDFIIRSREVGMNDKEIIEDLKDKGYGSRQILDMMKKSDLKKASSKPSKNIEPMFDEEELEPEVKEKAKPAPKQSSADVEELAEKIIEEKWETVKKELDELKKWKEESATAMEDLGKTFDELGSSIEIFKKQLVERLTGYSEGITDLGTDIKAMDMVFKQILPQLTSDVKTLSGIVGKVKKK